MIRNARFDDGCVIECDGCKKLCGERVSKNTQALAISAQVDGWLLDTIGKLILCHVCRRKAGK